MYEAIRATGILGAWPGGVVELTEARAGQAILGSSLSLGLFDPDFKGFLLWRDSNMPTVDTVPPLPYSNQPARELWLWGLALGLGPGRIKRVLDDLFDQTFSTPGLWYGIGPHYAVPQWGRAYGDQRFTTYDFQKPDGQWRIWVQES